MAQAAKTNSSRAIALERRKALSAGGKAALKNAGRQAGSSAAAGVAATASASTPEPSAAGASARAVSLARRKAMSSQGKAAIRNSDRVRADSEPTSATTGTAAVQQESQQETRRDCGCGCGGTKNKGSSGRDSNPAGNSEMPKARSTVVRRPQVAANPAKAAALARRKALSTLGKAGLKNTPMTEAQVARASNPKLSGRELARVLRDKRSKNGNTGGKKSAPCGRQRKDASIDTAAAQDAPWKVGASVTVSGQTVTGTMVGRHGNMTGDEPSTCRTITGTEYMGADIFSKFCQINANATTARKVEVTSTSHGNPVSGNRMGRGGNVTGNEPGTCKRVTGDEYTSAEQVKGYCGEPASKSPLTVSMAETMKGKSVTGTNVGRSENVTGNEYGMRHRLTGTQYTKAENIGRAPEKVGVSKTLRGGGITGTMVGRGERVTGDEPGSCRNVTGDDYIGTEQFSSFCKSTPQRTDRKVEASQTLSGLKVTGSLAGRSQIVTGDEPGTCKALTGTPYAGADQYQDYCDTTQAGAAQARMKRSAGSWGKPMTGLQPGINGKMTGADKGACETISGTPYVGADQAAESCPASAAEPGSADFPQTLGNTPWGDFSVDAPLHAAQHDGSYSHVTGSQYESGHITGPFSMAGGKVTGTEQARFDRQLSGQTAAPATAEQIHGRVKPRITGEGMEAGLKITGDDWDRGDSVTGTEGASATQRNQTRRGNAMSAMQMRREMTRPQDVPLPVSKVTGGSGNTEKGALITYSGGARG